MIHIRLIIEKLNVRPEVKMSSIVNNIPTNVFPLNVIDEPDTYKKTVDLLSRLVREGTFSGENVNDLKILGLNFYNILLGADDAKNFKSEFEDLLFAKSEQIILGLAFDENSPFIIWPWELMYIKSISKNDGFINDLPNLDFYRSINTKVALDFNTWMPKIDDKKLKILFVAAGPHKKIKLRDAEELKKSQPANIECTDIRNYFNDLLDMPFKDDINFKVDCLTEEDLNENLLKADDENEFMYQLTHEVFIKKLIEFNPDVLHIVAHGDNTEEGGQIAFMLGREIKWINENIFLKNYKDKVIKRRLRLVFFQTCDSALPGQFNKGSGLGLSVFKDNVHSVIAMQSRITQRDALAFARAFYEQLFDKENEEVNIIKAYKEARKSINNDSFFGIPVLYTHGEVKWYEKVGSVFQPQSGGGDISKCIWCGNTIDKKANFCSICGGTYICKNCKGALPPNFSKFKNNDKCPLCENVITKGSQL